MAKVYTAQEMRNTAFIEYLTFNMKVSTMLYQAADAIEREEKRNALIGELADALDSYLLGECIDCGNRCEGDEVCEHQVKHRALVAKALEVAK